eukprot:15351323-Ditylum_brightwellii.AAC.1
MAGVAALNKANPFLVPGFILSAKGFSKKVSAVVPRPAALIAVASIAATWIRIESPQSISDRPVKCASKLLISISVQIS